MYFFPSTNIFGFKSTSTLSGYRSHYVIAISCRMRFIKLLNCLLMVVNFLSIRSGCVCNKMPTALIDLLDCLRISWKNLAMKLTEKSRKRSTHLLFWAKEEERVYWIEQHAINLHVFGRVRGKNSIAIPTSSPSDGTSFQNSIPWMLMMVEWFLFCLEMIRRERALNVCISQCMWGKWNHFDFFLSIGDSQIKIPGQVHFLA